MMKVWDKLQDGREVMSCVLTNKNGMEVTLISFGAVIQSVRIPDAAGQIIDVVEGFADAEGYVKDTESFGAVVGRVANRTCNGEFSLDGVTYHLEQNAGVNNLHSGTYGFQHCLWDVADEGDNSVTFSIVGPDGQQGFPGNITVKVTYSLNDNNELSLDYEAVTDQATVVNLTNHVYFNLNGHGSGSIVDHRIRIDAERFTPVSDAQCIPTGELRPVEGTPLDLRVMKRIGDEIDSSYDQMRFGIGYDHNYVFGDRGRMKIMAEVHGESGICLETSSDQPGLQFYAGNWTPEMAGKDGAVYGYRRGFCLETQNYPDAINHPEFPSPVLRPGEVFRTKTIYRFWTE